MMKKEFEKVQPEAAYDHDSMTGILERDNLLFWQDVLAKRGQKLANDPSIQLGKIFHGNEALEAGLVD